MLMLLFSIMSIWFTYQFFKQVGNAFKDWWKEESQPRVVCVHDQDDLMRRLEQNLNIMERMLNQQTEDIYSPEFVTHQTMKRLMGDDYANR